jgi:hypothetical protein
LGALISKYYKPILPSDSMPNPNDSMQHTNYHDQNRKKSPNLRPHQESRRIICVNQPPCQLFSDIAALQPNIRLSKFIQTSQKGNKK